MCDRLECRAAWMRRLQKEELRIEEGRREAARAALRAEGVDPDAASWSPTPVNPSGLVPLTADRREAFLRHLRRTVELAVTDPADTTAPAGQGTPEGRFPPPGPDEARALAVGCAACRGWCCRRGGTHAFLEPDRIRRLLRERPELHAAAVVELYASHLGDEHLEGGCVFQGEDGCRLPRSIRGDTCNDYHCPDLVEARRLWRKRRPGGSHRFVAVARGDERSPRIRETPVPDS